MNLMVVLLLIALIFGGLGRWYYGGLGGAWLMGGSGLVSAIVLVVLLLY